jgi:hypothetical protein
MGHGQLNPVMTGEIGDRLSKRKSGYGRNPLRDDAPELEMLDQRIEARVFRNDMKLGSGVLSGKYADVVGNVEVECIGTRCLEENAR